MLGGYFLTPQTNPPTPWPAEKFADLFPRRSPRAWWFPASSDAAAAGLVATAATRDGDDRRPRRACSAVRPVPRSRPASRSPSGTATTPLHDLEIVLDEQV